MNRADTSHQSIPLDALASVVGGNGLGQFMEYVLPAFFQMVASMSSNGGNDDPNTYPNDAPNTYPDYGYGYGNRNGNGNASRFQSA